MFRFGMDLSSWMVCKLHKHYMKHVAILWSDSNNTISNNGFTSFVQLRLSHATP